MTEYAVNEQEQLLIKDGIVVTGSGCNHWDILIEGEKIAAVGPDISPDSGAAVIDASKHFVLPGIIDAHTHPYYADDFETLASTAAYGGVTTLIHYAYAFPDMSALDAAEQAVEVGRRVSCICGAVCG
jgi:dihydropyrimidinase